MLMAVLPVERGRRYSDSLTVTTQPPRSRLDDLAAEVAEGADGVFHERGGMLVVAERVRPDVASAALGVVAEELGDDLEDVPVVDDAEHREHRPVANDASFRQLR